MKELQDALDELLKDPMSSPAVTLAILTTGFVLGNVAQGRWRDGQTTTHPLLLMADLLGELSKQIPQETEAAHRALVKVLELRGMLMRSVGGIDRVEPKIEARRPPPPFPSWAGGPGMTESPPDTGAKVIRIVGHMGPTAETVQELRELFKREPEE